MSKRKILIFVPSHEEADSKEFRDFFVKQGAYFPTSVYETIDLFEPNLQNPTLLWSNSGKGESDAFLRGIARKSPFGMSSVAIVGTDISGELLRLAYELGIQLLWKPAAAAEKAEAYVANPAFACGFEPDVFTSLVKLHDAIRTTNNALLLDCEKALAPFQDEDARIAFQLGCVAVLKRDHAGALALFEKCLTLKTKYPPAMTQVAKCLLKLQRTKEALNVFEKLDGLGQGTDSFLKTEIAECFFALGEKEKAEQTLASAATLAGGSERVMFFNARNALFKGELELGMKLMSHLKTAEESDLAWIVDRGVDMVQEGKLDTGIRLYEEAYRISPAAFKSRIGYNLGIAHFKKGALDKATEILARADKEKTDPTWDKAAKTLEAIRAKGGKQ